MVNFASPNVLTLLLLVAPGLVGLKLYLRQTGGVDDFSRLDSVVFSLAFSFGSILLIYAGYSLLLFALATAADFPQPTLPVLFGGYLLHILVTCGLGFVVGLFAGDTTDGSKRTQAELWQFAFENIHADSKVRVTTTAGEKIEGNVLKRRDPVQARDLILTSPRRLDADGESLASFIGPYAYLHEQDISQVVFYEDLEEDLDRAVVESIWDELGRNRDRSSPDADQNTDLEAELSERGETRTSSEIKRNDGANSTTDA
jgi:hypothetical protein